jgi:hypothetical protein
LQGKKGARFAVKIERHAPLYHKKVRLYIGNRGGEVSKRVRCIVGACGAMVGVLDDDGTLNAGLIFYAQTIETPVRARPPALHHL